MSTHEELPGRLRDFEHATNDRPPPLDNTTLPARFGWLQLCVISSVGLAVGVLGTSAYILWFNRDQQAYTDAVQAARHAQPARASASASVAQNNSTIVGRITPAPAPVPAPPAAAGNATFASTQSSSDDDAKKAASATPANGASAPAARTDRSKLVANNGKNTGANRHAPPRVKPKETFVSRLSSMFRPVGYRKRAAGNNPDPYSHP